MVSTAAFSQVGIGTTTPDDSAILDVESTQKGFLPPRLTTTEQDNIDSPAVGLMVYNTDEQCLEIYVGLGWRNLCAVVGDEDVINPQTGAIWMDRNLGATTTTQTPRSDYPDNASYITAEGDSFGDLYQWGRAKEGHEVRTSSTTTNLANTADPITGGSWDGLFITSTGDWLLTSDDNLWQGLNGINNPCPSGYRLPTETEWNAELDSWDTQDANGAFDSILSLPLSGTRQSGPAGNPSGGSSGSYWSSTVSGTSSIRVNINTSSASIVGDTRAVGNSVRCIKD